MFPGVVTLTEKSNTAGRQEGLDQLFCVTSKEII